MGLSKSYFIFQISKWNLLSTPSIRKLIELWFCTDLYSPMWCSFWSNFNFVSSFQPDQSYKLNSSLKSRIKSNQKISEAFFVPGIPLPLNIGLTFMYETGGNDFWLLACCVERVSRLVTPRVTRAGTASGLIQKEIQDIITIKHVGIYVWKR